MMKKKIWIPITAAVVLLAILLIPIPSEEMKDGGTRAYTALTYKFVNWNRFTDDGTYGKPKLYFFPNNFKSIDSLWNLEKRNIEYNGKWLNKANAEKDNYSIFPDMVITEIYSNCFFAKPAYPLIDEYKLNGTLSDEWCVGDQVFCTYENLYYDEKTNRVEADLLTIEASDYEWKPGTVAKPVIYLYPEKETEVSVNLTLDGRLTCTYPEYNNGWSITASPDGTLTGADDQTYSYLYWEGESYAQYDLSKGFCVKGEDTAVFLEEALAKLGLTRREANEFIVYWLPLMQENPYNIISFQTDLYTDAAKLDVTPMPDTLIRVFMAWKAADFYLDLEKQELTAPARTGFTVVEWGGTEVRSD